MSDLTLSNISKKFDSHYVIKDFSYTFKAKKIYTLFGPNGCGKSSLLNIIAGIDTTYTGEIIHSYQSISYLFQQYRESLFPWLTVEENLLFPLQIQNISKSEQKKRLREIIDLLPIDISLKKYPYLLSGGQQQIIAFMRALILYPSLLLLDEPFSALDYEFKLQMQELLSRFQSRRQCSVICITHNLEENVFLADKILILGKNPLKIRKSFALNTAHPRLKNTLSNSSTQAVAASVLKSFSSQI